jgi:hypothetical protein
MTIRSAPRLLWMMFIGLPLVAQTLVDLATQSKSVNFQNAPSTKPMKTGVALPPICSQGDMFFLTTAAAGANLYGCVATNTWNVQAGSGGTGAVTIQNTGTVVGMRPILNLSTGQGLVLSTSDTGTNISIQSSLDSSIVTTQPGLQTGASLLCNSASTSATTYTCSMTPVLEGYHSGMVLHWKPDVDTSGGAVTLNIDVLGPVPVKLADGGTDLAPLDLIAGRMEQVWYDGTVFRLLKSVGPEGIFGEALPACGAALRGRLWFVAGGAGVKDSLAACAKDASGAFAWRTIY